MPKYSEPAIRITPKDFPFIYILPTPKKQEAINSMDPQMQSQYAAWATEEAQRTIRERQERFRAKEAREDAGAINIYKPRALTMTPSFTPGLATARSNSNAASASTNTLVPVSSNTPTPTASNASRLQP